MDLCACGQNDLTVGSYETPAVRDVLPGEEQATLIGGRQLRSRLYPDLHRKGLAVRAEDRIAVLIEYGGSSTRRERVACGARGIENRLSVLHRRENAVAKIGVAERQRQRGNQQTAHVDGRRRTEQEAVQVNQVHLSVRAQIAENLRRAGLENPVERDRTGCRLLEGDRTVGPDVERGPVENRRVRRLIDFQSVLGRDRGRGSRGDKLRWTGRPAGARGARHPECRTRSV